MGSTAHYLVVTFLVNPRSHILTRSKCYKNTHDESKTINSSKGNSSLFLTRTSRWCIMCQAHYCIRFVLMEPSSRCNYSLDVTRHCEDTLATMMWTIKRRLLEKRAKSEWGDRHTDTRNVVRGSYWWDHNYHHGLRQKHNVWWILLDPKDQIKEPTLISHVVKQEKCHRNEDEAGCTHSTISSPPLPGPTIRGHINDQDSLGARRSMLHAS